MAAGYHVDSDGYPAERINFQTEFVNGELPGAKWYLVTQSHPVLLVIRLQVLEVQDVVSYRVEFAQTDGKCKSSGNGATN